MNDTIGDSMQYRAILDTNVLVAALSSRRGASFVLLRHVINQRFKLLASPALWLEYEAVLKRPEITRMHQLTLQDIDNVLNALCEVVEPIQAHFLWRPQLRDPSDEMVLEAAINGAASHLVSFNLRDFDPPVQRHKLNVPARLGPVACRPADFLKLLENPS
jgi:putative PIN family toxin of toxin-antitoxin system